MIITFGSVAIDMDIGIDSLEDQDDQIFADNYSMSTGGRAAKQAIAAARSGAEVALIGKIGSDELATDILNQLRREGVTSAGIEQIETASGLNIVLRDEQGQKREIVIPSANLELSEKQIVDGVINSDSFLLLQTEILTDINAAVLERAKEAEATTIVNLAPSIDVSQKILDHVDYLIVNQQEAGKLAEKLGLSTEDDAIKLAEGFAKQGSLNCVITIGARGCVGYTVEGEAWSVEALFVDEIVDRTGAEDAYCGAFAAALQADMTMPRAMKRGSIAGSLACTKPGSIDSFPTQEEIDARINDVDDPQQL